MGVHDYGPTTAYPAGIALAASWDTDLAQRVGAMMATMPEPVVFISSLLLP